MCIRDSVTVESADGRIVPNIHAAQSRNSRLFQGNLPNGVLGQNVAIGVTILNKQIGKVEVELLDLGLALGGEIDGDNFGFAVVAVSYTHLDVYKRQE